MKIHPWSIEGDMPELDNIPKDENGMRAVHWLSSDTEELFRSNLAYAPKDWIYRTRVFDYQINQYNDRCQDPKHITTGDYVLFTGCSFSVGIGLPLEETFPYLLSQSLGIPYYNLSWPGTGIQVIAHRLMWWLRTFAPPKMIVLQIPELTRTLIPSYKISDVEPNKDCLEAYSVRDPHYNHRNNQSERRLEILNDFYNRPDWMINQFSILSLFCTFLKSFSIPVITGKIVARPTTNEVFLHEQYFPDIDVKIPQLIDDARDLGFQAEGLKFRGHLGTKTNQLLHDLFLERMKSKL